ncbi:MAG: hypothetical protein WB290_09255 [Smithella sp.]
MNTYIIDKGIKAAVIEKHFSQLSWLIKAIGKDEAKNKALAYIHIADGIYYTCDGHRLHCFLPDYNVLPASFNLPDGEYNLVTANKKQIILQSIDEPVTYPDINCFLNYRRYNGIDQYYLRSTSSHDLSKFNHHIISNTGQCFNLDYIKDAVFEGKIMFDRSDVGTESALVLGCETQFAMLMPIRLDA